MQNTKSLRDLLSGTGKNLSALKSRSKERSRVVEQVRSALPARLAAAVVSAGVEGQRLTIGVLGAVWASRIRYFADTLRKRLTLSLGVEVLTIRIRVVPPPADAPTSDSADSGSADAGAPLP